MAEMVTVRHGRTGNTARVPRSALPQMPKWREVAPAKSKSSGEKPAENSADTPSAKSEE